MRTTPTAIAIGKLRLGSLTSPATFDASIQSQYGFRLGVDSFLGFYESAKAQWLGLPSEVYMVWVIVK